MNRTFLLLLLIIACKSISAQKVTIIDEPAWVSIKDTVIESTVNTYELQNGYYYEQFDQRTHYNSESFYTRYKARILNSSGVTSFSQLNIPIDTAFQKVLFHRFIVHREGTIMDRTNDIELKLMNSETELEQNIFTGTMVVNSILNDVRKNDLIEIAYTVVGKNPLLGEEFHDIQFLQGENHVDYFTFEFIYPVGKTFYFKVYDPGKVTMKQDTIEKSVIYSFEATNVEPPYIEETMSFSINAYNIVEISSFDNWKDMKEWAKGLFREENSSDVDSLFNMLYKPDLDLLANATAILDYVQNNIRYTSVNGGIGSYRPALPSEVIDRNFGDCKDKTLLLIHLFDKLGIEEAYPAFVNSTSGKRLNEYLPGLALFDHVIARCKIGGEICWIDPSQTLQGGNVINRQAYPYGYALVLDDESDIDLMELKNDVTRTEVYETFDLSDAEGDASLKVITHVKGRNADYFRILLDQYSLKDLSDFFKETYSRIFLSVSTDGKLKIKDDLENNVITMEENYILRKPWQEVEEPGLDGFILSYEPMNIYNYVYPTSCDEKKYAIDGDKSVSYYQKTEMKLPEDAIYRMNNFETENSIYSFSKKQEIIDVSNTVLEYNIDFHKDDIQPDEFYDYCEDLNRDARNLLLNIAWLRGK